MSSFNTAWTWRNGQLVPQRMAIRLNSLVILLPKPGCRLSNWLQVWLHVRRQLRHLLRGIVKWTSPKIVFSVLGRLPIETLFFFTVGASFRIRLFFWGNHLWNQRRENFSLHFLTELICGKLLNSRSEKSFYHWGLDKNLTNYPLSQIFVIWFVGIDLTGNVIITERNALELEFHLSDIIRQKCRITTS